MNAIVIYFSRADENYFGGSMKYVEVGNTEIAVQHITELTGYDTIILAYPNYWGTMPMAVFTFLDNADLNGKTVYPLCTNEGSGLGKSVSDIKKYANDGEGLSLTGSGVKGAKSTIEKWLKNNKLI